METLHTGFLELPSGSPGAHLDFKPQPDPTPGPSNAASDVVYVDTDVEATIEDMRRLSVELEEPDTREPRERAPHKKKRQQRQSTPVPRHRTRSGKSGGRKWNA